MTNTQTLALAYAEKLVAYYETKSREAYAEMVNAQNALAYSAECEGSASYLVCCNNLFTFVDMACVNETLML